jgi:RimJ/RimL family protein N-acetyltransferase
MIAPTLTTARLVLRPLTQADFAVYAGFVTSDRTGFMGGPHDLSTAWAWFCKDVAGWDLLDMGGLSHQGTPVGQVALSGGPDFSEPELGWFLFAGFEGQGFATEVAGALRDWALGRFASIVSYIDPENAASIKVARRLGAVVAALTANNAPTGVYRYAH